MPRGANSKIVAYVAIYDLDAQRQLLEQFGDDLNDTRRESLELLVRARGPVDPEVLGKIVARVNFGRSYEYIAGALIEREIIDGMGKGWTASKVRRVYHEHLDVLRSGSRLEL